MTQHRTQAWLTNDLALTFSVFDRGDGQVPADVWERFSGIHWRMHGIDPGTVAEYVTDHSAWIWDTVFSSGTVVIGEREGPCTLEAPAGDDETASWRIMFWDDGTGFDTGLRVWAEEARIITQALRDRADREHG